MKNSRNYLQMQVNGFARGLQPAFIIELLNDVAASNFFFARKLDHGESQNARSKLLEPSQPGFSSSASMSNLHDCIRFILETVLMLGKPHRLVEINGESSWSPGLLNVSH